MIKARIDDPLDTVAVHVGGGLWGTVFAPWVMYGGVVFSGNGYQDQNNGIGDAFLVCAIFLLVFGGISNV
jgi:ammonia channel protein AmtB